MDSTAIDDDNMEYEQSPSFVENDDDNATVSSTDGDNNADSIERQLRKETEATIQSTKTQLEAILTDLKRTTSRLLEEIGTYMEAADSVSADYIRCQESQRKEAQRLEEVSPDVEGATNRFLEQQLAMMGGHMNGGGNDLAAMLSNHANQ